MGANCARAAAGDMAAVELELADDVRSPSQARRACDALDGHAHPETLARTRLLITEMVAAATVAGSPGGIRVSITAAAGSVRAEVVTGRAVARRPHGWGLLLVRRLSTRWGVTHGTLWFEVEDR